MSLNIQVLTYLFVLLYKVGINIIVVMYEAC